MLIQIQMIRKRIKKRYYKQTRKKIKKLKKSKKRLIISKKFRYYRIKI